MLPNKAVAFRDDMKDSIDDFIQKNFLWTGGMPSTPEDRLRSVRASLSEAVAPYRAAALALIASIGKVLDDLETRIPDRERARLFHRIDIEHLCKEPDSILEKMVRKSSTDGKTTPLSFGNFRDQMHDLARFRIVTNFLSDADLIRDEIEKAFGPEGITSAQEKLREGFVLEDNCLEDCTRIAPGRRTKGERCYKGIFWPQGNAGLKVELQVMTILQEAWDKKDHFLVYEPRRRGHPVNHSDLIEMFAMSELLFVADLTFDRLRQRIIDAEEEE
jgi:ppGpp synthetase/RelA/SpoT-type nucleotidyltranferase